MEAFEITIKNYLEKLVEKDSLFAESYKKENKSIKECCKYIYSQAKKLLAKGDNVVGIDDDTVFGWAVHYYDEDDIKVDKVQECVEVVTPPAVSAKVKQSKPRLKPQIRRKKVENNSLQLSLFGEL